jgi:pyruvate kinase
LSSLGRAEADVLGAVDAVLHVLNRLVGQPKNGGHAVQAQEATAVRGWDLLERNTEQLLGPSPKDRNVRIMVTMPSEAAVDFGLVRDLLLRGMNCMRVNCAHHGPEQWSAMISNLKRAMLETGHHCRIHMDLAPISHSWAEEDEVCSNWELRESFAGAVVLLIRFSLGRQFFLTPRLFRRTPYHRLT